MVRKITMKINAKYIKISLLVILGVLQLLVIMDYYGIAAQTGRYGEFIAVSVCGAALVAMEAANTYFVKNFIGKMIFYVLDSLVLFVISFLTGFAYLAAQHCIILTGCYISIDRFRDRTTLFAVSSALFAISFIVGWVLGNTGTSLYESFVSITSGALIGLLAIAIDYVVVQFIIQFIKNNRELSLALAAEAESKIQLERAYEKLTQTMVYEERNRIAKDIHDNAGHSMTTVIMQTEAAKLLIDTDPDEAKNRIIAANIQARNALDRMRESVHLLAGRNELRPIKSDIEEIIAQTVDGTDIKARLDIDDVQLTASMSRFITNTVKELMANGIRHGGATAFYIELKCTDGNLKLIVSDNGRGVDGKVKEGFGLGGIRQRAEELGGKAEFSGQVDEGFETVIELKIKEGKND